LKHNGEEEKNTDSNGETLREKTLEKGRKNKCRWQTKKQRNRETEKQGEGRKRRKISESRRARNPLLIARFDRITERKRARERCIRDNEY